MAKKHINVQQINIKESNVPSELITKLYNFIKRTEFGEDVWDAMDDNKIYNSLKGTFKTKGYTYEEYVNKINEYFENTLTIEAEGYYILFNDELVLNILLDKGFGDGIGITKEQAKNIIFNPWDMFKETEIEYFNEFKYFSDLNSKNTNPSNPHNNRSFCFKDNSNLKTIDLSNLTAPVPYQAFRNCTQLTSINNLQKCNYIGQESFFGCTSLTTIDLSNITFLGENSLAKTAISITNEDLQNIVTFQGDRDGGPFGYNNTCTLLNIENLDLPNCTYIGDSTFATQTNIKYVNLENISTLYGNKTFYGCTQLINAKVTGTYVNLLGDFWYGGNGMFEGCINLTNVELSPNLSILQFKMFRNCTSLTTVNFDDFQENITVVDGGVFYKANNITHRVFYFPRCIRFGGIYNEGRGYVYANSCVDHNGLGGNKSFYLPKITEIHDSYASNDSKGLRTSYFGEMIYMPYITLFSYNDHGQHYDHSIIKTLYFKNLNKVQASTFAGVTIDILIFNNVIPPQLEIMNEWTDVGDGNNGINLFNDDMFRTTIINDGIYVPDSAVETYKNTSYFHNVINKIKPLSQCPRITIEQGMNGVAGLIEEYMNEK